MCYEEAVVEMNVPVGDIDARVEKSPKKNEKSKATKRRGRSHKMASGREFKLGLQFHSLLGT
jgi:hypothetical protein